MPNLFQRFSRARNANGGDDPPPRPRTAAEEQLSRPATSAAATATSAAAAASNETLGVGGQVQGVSMPVAADSRTPADGPEDFEYLVTLVEPNKLNTDLDDYKLSQFIKNNIDNVEVLFKHF